MNRKDKLIIDLLDEVDRLEKRTHSLDMEISEIVRIKDERIQELELANEKRKTRILELESKRA